MDHINYFKIKEAIKTGISEEQMRKLVDIAANIKSFCDTNVTIQGGVICYNNMAVHNTISKRILELMKEGYPFLPMVKFLNNCMSNPDIKAVDELYDFLDHKGLPLEESGCFLAYKRVDDKFLDMHSHSIDNSIGKIVEIDRTGVDADRSKGCSYGLHAGTLEYVNGFHSGYGHVIIVKINPKDVISVPLECSCQKIRVCRYEVMYELLDLDLLNKSLYNEDGKECVESINSPEESKEIQELVNKYREMSRDEVVEMAKEYNLYSTKEEARIDGK